jgi:hypothetical protein
LRKNASCHTIKSVKPVKVAGFVSSESHQELLELAKQRKTTVGHLVAASVRLLLKSPAKALRGLPMDGRRA